MNTISRYNGHLFSRVPSTNIEHSKFDRSHTHLTTLDGGYLVPIFWDDALPSDIFNLAYKQVCRMTTPITPFMGNVKARLFFFSVPKRLLWENFENFITGGGDTPEGFKNSYMYPTIEVPAAAITPQSIFDYLGLPPITAGNTLTINSMRLRAYNLIYNEWFRDENLQNKVTERKGDSGDVYTDYTLLKRGKRHDYFTSCLPWPQKGVAVDLPLGDVAPVVGNGLALGVTDGSNNAGVGYISGQGLATGSNAYGADVGASFTASTLANGKSVGITSDKDKSGLIVDLSSATASTINEFRQAFQIQKLYEHDARGGSRYVESILSHFKTRSPDARLQRPEYLGGGEITFYVQSVAQTSASDSVTPQGNLAAVATANDTSGQIRFTHAFSEHCIVVGLICIYTDLTYMHGVDRFLTKSTRFDEYWPTLAHLGEQEILSREIFADGSADDDLVFGYQERYAEYRYKPSVISGKMRSGVSGSLDVWHLAQDFESRPTLSAEFIEENPPFARVLAVQDEPQFLLDSYFDLQCSRPLPLYGVPGLVDHF